MKHRYLITLEIVSLEVNKTYGELPSHLTLMSRFLSNLEPTMLANIMEPLFMMSKPVQLTLTKTSKLGPKELTVHLIEYSSELSHLHYELYTLLNSIHVKYEYPQFVGGNHKPHVTKRREQEFKAGDGILAKNCYLIEIINQQRVIQSKFKLSALVQDRYGKL
jgi:hypothetical protein